MWLACLFFNHKTIFRDTFNSLKSTANDHRCSGASKRSLFTCTPQSGYSCSSPRPVFWAVVAHVVATDLLLNWRVEPMISLQCSNITLQNLNMLA